ncbi:MAG TPA: hypothetical protein VFP84_35185 [Kofleriaceae bacterium]|nr:hypothetical protein [Kofleriaceae bacterium]
MWRSSTWLAAIALCAACGTGGNAPPLPDAPAGYMGPVTLEVNNHAAGVVTSTPAGVACPPTCDAMFDMATEVTLVLKPTNGGQYLKAEFDAPCERRGNFACAITIAKPVRINVYGDAAN